MVSISADNSDQLPDGPRVETVCHREIVEADIPCLHHLGELMRFETCYCDLKTFVGQSGGKNILDTLGAGIVFAVYDMQNSNGLLGLVTLLFLSELDIFRFCHD